MPITPDPLLSCDAALIKSIHHLVIALEIEGKQQLEPIYYQGGILLSSYEVVLIGKMPLGFRIEFFVYCPLERRSVVRVPDHEDFRQVAETVKYVLTWILAYVDQPIKIFQSDV